MDRVQTMEVTSIAVKLIRPSAKQPKDRTKDVAALAASVKAIGIIQPIHVVEKAGRFQGSGERYEIVAGHRRWAAAKVAGLEMIPAIVLDLDKTSQQVIRMTENVHRRQLTSMEEAMAIEVLLKMHRSYDEIAADLAMSATTVARRARLLSLIPKWRKLIDELPASSLELVARYDNKRQEALYDRFNGYLPETDRLKAILAEADHRLSSAPWKQDDEALFPKAGSCAKCEKRSDCQALLFHEDDGAKAAKTARCLDPTCWDVKLQAFITRRRDELKTKSDTVLEIQTQYTGREVEGALRPYQFERAKKTDKGAKPAVVLDGPQAGHVMYVKVKREERASSRAKQKLADMKPAERAKARDQRLLGRRSMHVVKALREILEKKEPALRGWAQGERRIAMIQISIAFGLRSAEIIGEKPWSYFMKLGEMADDEAFDIWWKVAKDAMYKPLGYIQRTEQAAEHLEDFSYFATAIMGCSWEALKRDAVAAIPDRRLKEGEADPFDPGDRAPKTKAAPKKRKRKAKAKK